MPEPHNHHQSVLDRITGGQLRMRPRWLFMLEHISIAAAIVVVAVGLVYLGSFIVYLWRTAHLSALPGFGPGGTGLFFRDFPWWHLGIILLSVIAFIYLLRRHTHLYRWPLSVTLGVFVLAFGAATWVTAITPLHERLADEAFRGGVPIAGPWYRANQPLVRGLITPGKITKVNKKNLTLQTMHGSVNITINDQTQLEPNWQPAVGQLVVVIGEQEGSTITAAGIRPLEHLPPRDPFRLTLPMDETNDDHSAQP